MPSDRRPAPTGTVSIARALSKLGVCSRAEGERLVTAGRVRVDGVVIKDLVRRVVPETARIEVDGAQVGAAKRMYVMLNKPRGLVTTRDDPQGRATIYECLNDPALPFLAPVGRLDKASEGLLLLTNDSRWAARLFDPKSHVDKVYHVQVRTPDPGGVIARIEAGVVDAGETLTPKSITLLRTGSRGGAWFEVTLDEGKNRQIRRVFEFVGVEVLRLIRVSVGPLALGELPKGEWRELSLAEVKALTAQTDKA